jgi:hypothetical protein
VLSTAFVVVPVTAFAQSMKLWVGTWKRNIPKAPFDPAPHPGRYDVAVVRTLRTAGHDVSAVVEVRGGADDVLVVAGAESRALLTEDKNFG